MSSETLRCVVLLSHAFVTLAMVGVIWFVQIVHYPLFARVGEGGYAAYQREHMSRTSVVVGPLMLAEMACAAAIVGLGLAPLWLGTASAVLLGVVWMSTWLLQVPLHRSLEGGFDRRASASLVSTNWIRTIAWTARGVLSLLMLLRTG